MCVKSSAPGSKKSKEWMTAIFFFQVLIWGQWLLGSSGVKGTIMFYPLWSESWLFMQYQQLLQKPKIIILDWDNFKELRETEEQEIWQKKIISSSLLNTYSKKTGKAQKFEK